MIEPKERACKGIGKAVSVKGCGTKTIWRRYGLCPNCLADFLFGTDAGKMLMHKSVLPKAKTKFKRLQTAKDKEAREKIKTKSDYEKELQKEINTIVRLLDKHTVCISTLKPLNAKYDAGHFFTTKAHPELRFNLFNIYAQSVYANQYLSGDISNFLDGLSHVYGKEHKEYVLNLKTSYKPLKLTIDELKEFTYKARSIVKWLKLQDRQFTIEERLEYRKKFNLEIGIYK